MKVDVMSTNKKIDGKFKYTLLFGYMLFCILFAIPSIIYLLKNKTIVGFSDYYHFFLNNSNIQLQVIAYIMVLTIISIFYLLIIKNRKKIFDNIRQEIIYIGIVSLIFVIIIPFTSSDIFYYMGTGRLDGKYGKNPYYVSMDEYKEENNINIEEDTVMYQGYENVWRETTVVYGPIWQIMNKTLGRITGNVDLAIVIYKMVNVCVHIFLCFLLYKCTNKKIFVLTYGLNPLVLFECISNVHNDIFILMFVVLSIYFLVKRKNICLSVLFLALSAGIKYFTVLFLPFYILYHFRKEKTGKKIGMLALYGFLFLIFFIVPYFLYIKDISIFTEGITTQQGKYYGSIYIVIFSLLMHNIDLLYILQYTQIAFYGIFIASYVMFFIKILYSKKITILKTNTILYVFILFFVFSIVTNLHIWYIIWIMPLMIFQKAQNVKDIMKISIAMELSYSVFLLKGEGYINTTPQLIVFALIMAIWKYYEYKAIKDKQKNKKIIA